MTDALGTGRQDLLEVARAELLAHTHALPNIAGQPVGIRLASTPNEIVAVAASGDRDLIRQHIDANPDKRRAIGRLLVGAMDTAFASDPEGFARWRSEPSPYSGENLLDPECGDDLSWATQFRHARTEVPVDSTEITIRASRLIRAAEATRSEGDEAEVTFLCARALRLLHIATRTPLPSDLLALFDRVGVIGMAHWEHYE